ncbi:MAG: uncharacterized protein A8A55_2265 [Amphiamblys sp. WSBS2006]|nr:MAG: uncharacterized protein A8A55_2265 [Amphiamblys sp. WSBS2006]
METTTIFHTPCFKDSLIYLRVSKTCQRVLLETALDDMPRNHPETIGSHFFAACFQMFSECFRRCWKRDWWSVRETMALSNRHNKKQRQRAFFSHIFSVLFPVFSDLPDCLGAACIKHTNTAASSILLPTNNCPEKRHRTQREKQLHTY